MGRKLISLPGRLLIVGALFLAFAGPASASPCWKSVVLDWSADGTVDKTYPVACYHQAIAHLQPDLKLYSSASDDIRRALQTVVTTNSETVATTTEPETPASTPTTKTTTPQKTDTTSTEQAPEQPAKTTPKPTPVAVGVVASDSGGGVPTPLIVLGGLALLLVVAGLAGMLWRRSQGDRPGTP